MSDMEQIDSIASDVPTVSAQAVELGRQLVGILEGTMEGFESQGKMAKKMGLRMFKKNAGMPIEEWIQYAKDLMPELEKLKTMVEKGDKEGRTQIMDSISEAIPKLNDLKENYIKTADLAGKFIKGEELEEALEGLKFSEKGIDLLRQAIEFLKSN